ncbi:MAG TPA: cupredoxin family copper-binding protein [Nitrosopumilaceae archaeon]|nr:cupredoxin family copper-binding protein [Nitrosopumilaceae archaeon]
MVSQAMLIGIAVVFFAGLGVGYAVFQSYNQPNFTMMTPQQMQQMMNNPQMMTQWHQTMMNNPQAMNSWMNTMANNPQTMNQWMGSMMQNPQFMQSMMSNPQFNQQWTGMMMNNPNMMNQWMGNMMSNPDFQQQYMGPYMMMRDPQFMQNMRNQYAQQTNLESLAIATDKVSILADTWQYQSTKAYSPAVIKVSAGTTVTWTNDDKIIHTVTDLGNEFDSGFIQPDETWKHTFDAKGNYYYFCSIHPWMKGAVIVS